MKPMIAQANELSALFRAVGTKMRGLVPEALEYAGNIVEKAAKDSIKGRTDTSVEGEPFRVKTGLARSSITHRMVVKDGKFIEEIGTNVSYFVELELGSSSRPKAWKHPVLGPALLNNADAVLAIINAALRKSKDGK